MNGTVLINSKNPFQYQGLSILLKEGVNNIDKSQSSTISPFHDFSFRWAKAFYDKIAFKIGAEYLSEKDLIDPETKNIKLSGAFHYKLTPNIEAQLMGYWATGNSVYTGSNRYAFKDIQLGQYKLEIRHPDWFVRAYTTQENAGQAYSATITAQYLNEDRKPSFDP